MFVEIGWHWINLDLIAFTYHDPSKKQPWVIQFLGSEDAALRLSVEEYELLVAYLREIQPSRTYVPASE